MNKKSISELISWVLLIGLTVTSSVLVANYLLKQTKEQVSHIEEDNALYCPEVGLSGNVNCYRDANVPPQLRDKIKEFDIDLINKGNFNIIDLTIAVKNSEGTKTLKKGTYKLDILPIGPEENAILTIGEDFSTITPNIIGGTISSTAEIYLTPIVTIEDKDIRCNEKVFKLKNIVNIKECT